jgi:hypothetical protein
MEVPNEAILLATLIDIFGGYYPRTSSFKNPTELKSQYNVLFAVVFLPS